MTEARPSIENLTREIERLVAERQSLRDRGASTDELERNRKQLVDGQALMSRLLIDRYLPQADAA